MNTEKPKASPAILHIAPTPFFSDRGCHIRIAGVVRCLDKLGFSNGVCTYHTGRDLEDITTHRISNIPNYTKTSAGPSPYKLWADLKLLFVCIRQYRRIRPAAIHAHLHEGILIGLLVKLVFFWHRTPLVADMQGSLTGELETFGVFNKYPFLKWPVMGIERALLWLSNRIVCSSQHSVDLFNNKFPESAKKVTLAQDGADAPAPINPGKLEALRSSLGIDPDAVCIIYSGALLDGKGLQELKALIQQAKALKQKIQFLIIGYPTEELEAFVQQHDLAALCTLTGQLKFSELADHLALGNIAIDPKNTDAGEGSGKILNYMANGMAVVAFDTINNRQFLGTEARLASDVSDAYQILQMFVNDQEAAQQAGSAHYDRFKKTYSWNVCQMQLQSVYQRLALI